MARPKTCVPFDDISSSHQLLTDHSGPFRVPGDVISDFGAFGVVMEIATESPEMNKAMVLSSGRILFYKATLKNYDRKTFMLFVKGEALCKDLIANIDFAKWQAMSEK